MGKGSDKITTSSKNTMLELANVFKKKRTRNKSQFKRTGVNEFETQFYNPNPPSSRKKHKKKKEPKPQVISRGEALIQSYLKKNNIAFTREKGFDDMVSPRSGVSLKMDFYLDDLITCIEFDGKQHFFPSKKFDTPTCNLETRQANDRAKDFYCLTKGIEMIRIRYDEINQIASILDARINLMH